jgi:hypothetical protein
MRPVIEETLYIEKVKIDNKEVVEFFGEDYLYVKGAQLFQAGKVKTAREAVDAVIKEAKEKLGKVQTNPQPLQTPPQAMGEAGANVAPAPTPPPKEITPEDELRSRHERRRQQGLE